MSAFPWRRFAVDMTTPPDSDAQKSPNGVRTGMAAAFFAAAGASACCVAPALLAAVGIGGAWATRLSPLEAYRPWFIGVAIFAVGFAFIQEYRARQCDDKCDNTRPPLRAVLLLIGAGSVALMIAAPSLIGSATASSGEPVPRSDNAQTLVLDIEGMTCEACAPSLRAWLHDLEGVAAATVTFDPPVAIVTADTTKSGLREILAAVEDVGYRGSVRSIK